LHISIFIEKIQINIPLPFGKYVVHHIDGEKQNNSIKNLYICTKEQHNEIHSEQKARLKRFANASELDYFLKSRVPKGQKTLSESQYEKFVEEKLKRDNEEYLKEERETKEPEEKNLAQEKKRTKTSKEEKSKIKEITIAICVIIAIIILFVTFNSSISNNPEPTSPNHTAITGSNSTINNKTEPVPAPKLPDYTINGSKTDVIIKNNLNEEVSLNVTYRLYSTWYGVDIQESKIFDVGANTTQSFKVFGNTGCSTDPCSVIILSYNKI